MTPDSQLQRRNLWSGIGVTLVACWLLVWLIPRYGGSGMAFGMHPQRLATLGAWVMLICAAILLIVSFIRLKQQRAPLLKRLSLIGLWHQAWPFLYLNP